MLVGLFPKHINYDQEKAANQEAFAIKTSKAHVGNYALDLVGHGHSSGRHTNLFEALGLLRKLTDQA